VKVTIVGAGVVGAATGIGLSRKGNIVTFYDINYVALRKRRLQGLKIAQSLSESIKGAEVVVLCLPTPPIDGTLDMSFLERVAEDIGPLLDGQIVVSRSTVVPGTTRKLSRYVPPEDLVYNPAFLRHRFALDDFLSPERIVIGTQHSRALKRMKDLYRNITAPIICTDWETAETAKLFSNAFLATKISFFNELWGLCEKLGVNTNLVEKILAMDKRIGAYGTKGGAPFDGPCLPKDSQALLELGMGRGVGMGILQAVLLMNRQFYRMGHNPEPFETDHGQVEEENLAPSSQSLQAHQA